MKSVNIALEIPKSDFEAIALLNNRGEHQEALQKVISLERFYPNSTNLIRLKAKILTLLERYSESIEILNKLIKLHEHNSQFFYDLGEAHFFAGEHEKASRVLTRLLKKDPNFYYAYVLLSNSYRKIGKHFAAEKTLHKARFVDAQNPIAYELLCELYEDSLKFDAIKGVLTEAKEKLVDYTPSLLYFEGQLLFKAGNFDGCLKVLSSPSFKDWNVSSWSSVLQLKGRCYDKLGNHDLAFSVFTEMNQLHLTSNPNLEEVAANYRRIYIQLNGQVLDKPPKKFEKKSYKKLKFTPIFLVGFPRSGTTLLDTALRGHPKLSVAEEFNVMSECRGKLNPDFLINDIDSLERACIEELRSEYVLKMCSLIEETPNEFLIDKYPLNIVHIPLICNMFPESKFILAVRHPLDVALSCYMQNFKINGAMANLLKLDSTYEMYDLAMSFFDACTKRYSISFKRIHYEDMVSDYSGTLTNLLKFLELEWDDNLADHTVHAKKRTTINTPSYDQVVLPIYDNAKFRWLNYQKYLVGHKTLLEQWIDKFGY